jgi:hypothetical protein
MIRSRFSARQTSAVSRNKVLSLFIIITLLAGLLATFGPVPKVLAATITVTTQADGSYDPINEAGLAGVSVGTIRLHRAGGRSLHRAGERSAQNSERLHGDRTRPTARAGR